MGFAKNEKGMLVKGAQDDNESDEDDEDNKGQEAMDVDEEEKEQKMHKKSLKGNLQRSKISLNTTRVYEDEVIKSNTLKTRRIVRGILLENRSTDFGYGEN
ncbi:hypothetical protein M9H77_26455 [Catharanthus roseus]|uniref:Uncharacterized protein n=1 Tax=Catharanthus roseus TaxID=4058 RepID=A0ACC0ACG1_CATRO|nr:hypothetical protein M9H77_26455 [Catharanthus roseus]